MNGREVPSYLALAFLVVFVVITVWRRRANERSAKIINVMLVGFLVFILVSMALTIFIGPQLEDFNSWLTPSRTPTPLPWWHFWEH